MCHLQAPTRDELAALSQELHMHCTVEELDAFEKFLSANVAPYRRILSMPEPVPRVIYPRTPGHRPTDEENPLNAWQWKCSVKGDATAGGKLHGMTVAVKDNTFVAGVPMANGSRTMQGFVPEFDATIVTRLLDAGAEIVGKSSVPDLCFSGSSMMNAYGDVRNPWNPTRSAGGSSSGSAVLVATEEVRLATGGDQGGSIRIPASICGIVGMKPTYGLVPYTGICPIETSVDHVGPMARTVSDCALMLEVIAGYDNDADPRQPSCGFAVPQYTVEMLKSPENLRIGVLLEGFDVADADTQNCVRTAVELIRSSKKFSTIDDISLPSHLHAAAMWSTVVLLGSGAQLLEGGGFGTGTYGLHSAAMSEHLQRGMKTCAHALSPMVKSSYLWYKYFTRRHGTSAYDHGQTLLLAMRRQYDALLKQFDVLLMPTLPQIACKLWGDDMSLHDAMVNSFNMLANTSPFNCTHHPALTLNAGFVHGLPVGMQLVGRRWDDATVLQVAYHIESVLMPLQTEKPTASSSY